MAEELQSAHPDIALTDRASFAVSNLTVPEIPPSCEVETVEEVPSLSAEPWTHFLLYLNFDTFVGDAGQQLAAEVRQAMKAKLSILMPHENDPAKGGCQFERCERPQLEPVNLNLNHNSNPSIRTI